VEGVEYWATCSNCHWSWGPGSEDEANAATLEHSEQTGHQTTESPGGTDTSPPGHEP
jgi:hypothetical protein